MAVDPAADPVLMALGGDPRGDRGGADPGGTGPGRDWYFGGGVRSWTCPPAPAGVAAFHGALPGAVPTPLVELPALAAALGVGRLFVKDESARLGLPSFKILGVSYAVSRLLGARTDEPGGAVTLEQLRASGAATPVELVTATDGNHGRALARMARLLQLPSRIYLPATAADHTETAILTEGARVLRVEGDYDAAVRAAVAAVAIPVASKPPGVLVQDTAWPGYEQVPSWIVDGYSTLFTEIDTQLAHAAAPDAGLTVVPVGVGSLAQAAVTHYRSRGAATALLGVEPHAARCVLESLTRDHRHPVATSPTVLESLNCGTPSSLAWPYLRGGLDAATSISDHEATAAVDELSAAGLSAGPCGAACLSAARAAALDPHPRAVLGLTPHTTVVLLSTEAPPGYPGAADRVVATGQRATAHWKTPPP